jgi:hypothetical protein
MAENSDVPANTCVFGPYLTYAVTTKFRVFHDSDDNDEVLWLHLVVEFLSGVIWQNFIRAMTDKQYEVRLGGAGGKVAVNSTYATLQCKTAAVTESAAVDIWNAYASRVELSQPLTEAADIIAAPFDRVRQPQEIAGNKVLIGVLDDGCPFAAERFLLISSAVETRLWALWDQDTQSGIQFTDSQGAECVFGQRPKDFLYGCEFLRRSTQAKNGAPKQLGLNEWIELHTMSGLIDEDGCYADAGFQTLRYRVSHGAHIMDVIAGPKPTSSRISLDPTRPPTFATVCDQASAADIVFVQFPKNCIEDASGVWLDAYVLDGVRYVLSCAGEAYDRVVINISYGRNTGPHNGTALLEKALTELVTEFDGSTANKPKLEIALAAGNSYLSDSNVVFHNADANPSTFQWTWRIPPDNSALCFAEVWMKNDDSNGVTVTLTSPSKQTFTSTGAKSPAGVEGPIVWGDDTMWRLQVEATEIAPKDVDPSNVFGEFGDYKVTVCGVPQGAKVYGYVARTDPNLDVLPGAKASWFIDTDWGRDHAASAGCSWTNGEFDNSGSFISRHGTLNGIATAEVASVHVAGGYMLSNERKSPYASAGPARGGPLAFRKGPDFAMLCDESYALEGIPAGGNRSGVVFRLIGTSTGAPQLARWIILGALPAPTNPPEDDKGIEERGRGNLMPP